MGHQFSLAVEGESWQSSWKKHKSTEHWEGRAISLEEEKGRAAGTVFQAEGSALKVLEAKVNW